MGLLAWLIVIGVAGFIFVGNNAPELIQRITGASAEPTTDESEAVIPAPSLQMTFAGRYAIGAGAMAPAAAKELIKQIDQVAHSDAVEIMRAAMVVAELEGAEPAVERLRGLDLSRASEGEYALLAADRDALLSIYETGNVANLSAEQQGALIEHHGWFGRLALGFDQPNSNPERAIALAQAQQLVLVIFVAFVIGGFAFLSGFVLAILALVRISGRKVRWFYARPVAGGSVYLEAFAIFLVGFIGISVLSEWVYTLSGIDTSRVLVWLLALCPLWPLARGADPSAWRYAIGWHKGQGVFKEIGAGIVGYLAGLPVLLLGVGVMFLLLFISAALSGGEEPATPTHPLGDEMMGGNWLALVGLFTLATIWAPFVEETMFRGCLYHHFRGRVGALVAAFGVAFIFASIHPQGWLAIPPLMSLAIVFALIREWRGSIIAPAVAHAMNNGFIFTMLYLALA
jgi:membrane protease YdiL (CAAX protease family)